MMRTVGMAGKMAGNQKGPQNKALQADTAGGLSTRHRPQHQTASSWPALQRKQQLPTTSACLSPCSAGKWGSAVVLAAMKAGADLPNVSTPPIAFACHCPYPLP